MATEQDYSNIDNPYNSNMERSTSIPDNSVSSVVASGSYQEGTDDKTEISSHSLTDMYLETWIKSRNYQTKTLGFYIDGKLGYIECMKLYVGKGGIIGGSLDIPDETSTNSFHADNNGNAWWGANVATGYLGANASILNTGDAVLNSVTIHGRSGQALSDAINDDADLVTDVINTKLDTSSKSILSDFTFGAVNYAGAVKSGDIVWDTTTGAVTGGSGVVTYRKGIVGASSGVVTFSIDATTGNATFKGDITASTITGSTITGGTLQTAEEDQRVVISGDDNVIYFYNSSNANTGNISGGSTGITISAPTGNNVILNAENSSYFILFRNSSNTTCYVSSTAFVLSSGKIADFTDGKLKLPVGTNLY